MNILGLSMASKHPSFTIFLAYGSLTVLATLMPCWYIMIHKHMEKQVNLNTANIVSQFRSEIEHSTELLHPLKSSSTNLARLLNSTLDSTNISFSDIDTKVAPLLFQAFATVPHLREISYIGLDGNFLSYYYNDGDQAFAMYSNSSGGAISKTLYYYIQPMNNITGKLYGEAIISNHTIHTSLLLHEALNIPNHGFASMGRTKWNNGNDILFMNSARVTRKGVISLGFSAKAIIDHVTRKRGNSCLVTKDGNVVVQGIKNTHLVISNDTVSFLYVNANEDYIKNEGTVSCNNEVTSSSSSLNIQDTQYFIHCHPIDLMGIESVYVLAIPQNKSINLDQHFKERGLILFIVMMVMIFVAIFSFGFINVRAKKREMHLCASLIKQMEATQQAERKNMNKSHAFATASHDVRAYLAGLVGLIEMSFKLLVPTSQFDTNFKPRSELETNLKQMEDCTKDLLGLLNSILDTSKIEAGKMQLEEEEFDVFRLLEDVVDLYHPMATKKNVDLVLDPCNGSIIRYSRVKGDRGKLKQVLCNLLSNAVKFTDEGHITVRAWVRDAKLQNSIIKTNQCGLKKHLPCLFCEKNETHEDLEKAMSTIQHDSRSMEFVFEVDDTGKGIPKENHKLVFENYVQVKETSVGQVGTGLGLGIVQSLVRLMHGDIGIMEKDCGEKGTCFRFNVLLNLCESELLTIREGNENGSSSNICANKSPMLNICSPSRRHEPSRVILYIADEERLRTSQMFMESLGIKVNVVNHWKDLFYTLKKIKQKGHNLSDQSSPECSDLSFLSTSSYNNNSYAARVTRVPFRSMDTIEYISSVFKKTNLGAAPGFILMVIDVNAGPFSKIFKVVSNFKKDLSNPCKVVWLDKSIVNNIDFKTIDQDDIVISKPFHGSRLFDAIKLLPEYGGNWQTSPRLGISSSSSSRDSKSKAIIKCSSVQQEEIQECGELSYCKPLSGKKFLVVEDVALLRKITLATLMDLGATCDQCENGEQAVKLVSEVLTRDFPNPPFDYILMDCQMPVMDGFEATRQIREMEKCHGLHIPIIALTADIDKNTTETGMDFHIVKPITKEHILKAIKSIHKKELLT